MPFSHHSHSGQFCGHATNTLEEVIQEAIAKKMQLFALTEHMPRSEDDLYPEEVSQGETANSLAATFHAYYREAQRLRQKYAESIDILVGMEIDWIRPESSRVWIEDLRAKYGFDLFIGSIHHVHTIPIDYDRAMYEQAREKSGGTDERLFEDYFDEQLEMLQTLRPPIVGHFDLIRLKSDNANGSFQRWHSVWQKVLRNLAFVAQYGGIVELNSAALRKGMNEPYPKAEICKQFLDMGGRFTLSDDSHGVPQVAFGYHDVLKFAEQSGITSITILEKGTNTEVGTRDISIENLKLHRFFRIPTSTDQH